MVKVALISAPREQIETTRDGATVELFTPTDDEAWSNF